MRMRWAKGGARKILVGAVGVLVVSATTAGCGAGQASNTAPTSMKALHRQALPSWVKMPPIDSLKTRGNVGEKPTWYNQVKISKSEVKAVRAKHLKAAFLNWGTGAYNQAVLQGAKDSLKALGIDLVAVTNNNMDEAQLQTDVRNVMALQPDIIFYSGIDPVADAAALKPAVDAGVAVVSFANAPKGWTTGHPDSFVSLISYDTYGNGAAVADAVAKKYPNGAKLGMIYFDANYKLVNEREQGFQDELKKTNVQIVTKQPMTDPTKTQPIAAAMLTRYPDLNVIFAPWDLPADGVLAAINAAHKEKQVGVAHIDVGTTGAKQIACGGPIFVMSSQLVYEWGRTGAIAAALHELGKKVPPYIVVPVFAVTHDNLVQAWNLAYGGHIPLPAEAQKCVK